MSKIKLPHASGNSMSIAAPVTNPASDLTLTLPTTTGTTGQVLSVDGSGNLVWTDNTPMWFARLNGNYGHGAPNTWVDAQLATEVFDTDGAFNTSTYKFTVPSGKAGKYVLYYQQQANDNPDDGENIQGRVLKNGSSLQYSNLIGISSGANQTTIIGKSWVEPLAVGDELKMQLYQNDPGNTVTYNQYNTYFGGYRLIGG